MCRGQVGRLSCQAEEIRFAVYTADVLKRVSVGERVRVELYSQRITELAPSGANRMGATTASMVCPHMNRRRTQRRQVARIVARLWKMSLLSRAC